MYKEVGFRSRASCVCHAARWFETEGFCAHSATSIVPCPSPGRERDTCKSVHSVGPLIWGPAHPLPRHPHKRDVACEFCIRSAIILQTSALLLNDVMRCRPVHGLGPVVRGAAHPLPRHPLPTDPLAWPGAVGIRGDSCEMRGGLVRRHLWVERPRALGEMGMTQGG
jgi:hypothetical protein